MLARDSPKFARAIAKIARAKRRAGSSRLGRTIDQDLSEPAGPLGAAERCRDRLSHARA